MTLRRLSAVCILLAAIAAPLPQGYAQMGLDRAIVSSETITTGQTEQIRRHIEQWSARLADENPTEGRRARDQLMQPLRERAISVAFRQAYSEALVPQLRDHALAENDRVVVNTLRIAGELATPRAVQILEQKLQDGHEPIRLSAVVNIGNVFAVVRDYSPAIGPEGVQQLISRLDGQLQRERDPVILDACIRSLGIAMQIARNNYEMIQPAAFGAMARRVGERATTLGIEAQPDEVLRVFLRAADVTRDVMTDSARPLNEQSLRQAAEMNGHMLAYIVRRLQGGGFPHGDTDGRYVANQIVTVTETTIIMAAGQLRANVQPVQLSQEFAKATADGDRQFRDRALNLLSALTRPPFNFGVNHFGGGR